MWKSLAKVGSSASSERILESPSVQTPSRSPDSPNMFVLSPREGDRSIVNSSLLESEKELLEKQAGELMTLRHKLTCMEAYQNDLMDEIKSLQEENQSMTKTVEEFQKEKRTERRRTSSNFRDRSFSNPTFFEIERSPSPPSKELEEELKKTKATVLKLEDKIYELEQGREEVIHSNHSREDSFKEMKETIKLLQQELCQSIDEKHSLESAITEKESAIESLQKHCCQLKEILSDLRRPDSGARRVQGLSKGFVPNVSFDTSSANISMSEEVMDLGQEIIDIQWQETKEALEKAEENLKACTEKHRLEVSQLNERISSFEADQSKLQEELLRLREELAAGEISKRDLESQLSVSREETISEKNANEEYKLKLERLKLEYENCQRSLMEDLSALQAQLASGEISRKDLECQLSVSKEEAIELKQVNEEYVQKLEDLKLSSENCQHALQEKLSALQVELDSGAMFIKDLESQLSLSKDDALAQKKISEEHRLRAEQLELDIETCKRTFQNELASLQAELVSGETSRKDLETQLSFTKEEAIHQSKLHEEYKLKLEQLQLIHDDFQRDVEDQLTSLRAELASEQTSSKDLESKLSLSIEDAITHKRIGEEYKLKTEQLFADNENNQRRFQEELSSLRAELATGETSRKDLESQLSFTKEEAADQKKVIEEYKLKLEQFQLSHEDYKRIVEEELSGLRTELASEQTSGKHLVAQLSLTKEDALTHKKISEDYKLRIEQLLLQNENTEATFKAELSALRAELASEQISMKDLESQLCISQKDCIALKKIIEEYKLKVTQLQQDIENDRRTFQDEVSALQAELASEQKCSKDLQTQLCSSKEDTISLNKVCNEYKERVVQLESDIENCRHMFQQELSSLQAELAFGEVSRKDLESQLSVTKEDAADQKKLHEEYKLKLEQVQSSHEDYQRTVEDELSRLRAELASGELSRKDLECQLSVSKEETIAQHIIIEEYKLKLEQLQISSDSVQRVLQEQLSMIQVQLSSEQTTRKELETQLSVSKEETIYQKEVNEEYKVNLEQLQSNHENYQRCTEEELSSLRTKLASEQTCSKELETQLAVSKEETIQQKQLKEECERRVEELEIENEKSKFTYQEDLSALRAELASEQLSVKDLQSQLSRSKEDSIALNKIIDEYKLKLEQLRLDSENSQRRLQEELSALKTEWASEQTRGNDLQSQLSDSKEEALQQQQISEEYKLKLEQLQTSHEKYQCGIKEELSALRATLSSEQATKEDLQAKLSVSNDVALANEKTIEEYKAKVEQLELENGNCERTFQEELSALRAELASEQLAMEDLRSQLFTSKEDAVALGKISDDNHLRAEQLQLEIENCRRTLQEELSTLQDELASEQLSRKQLESQLSISKEDAIHLKEVNEEYVQKLEDLKLSTENCQRALQEELSALKVDLASGAQCIKDLETQLSLSKDDALTQKNISEEYQLKLEQSLADNENNQRKFQDELSSMQADLTAEQMSNQDLQSQLLVSKEETLARNKICEEYKLRLEQLQTEKENCQHVYQEELSTLQTALASEKISTNDLQSQLSVAKEEAIHLKTVNEEYEEKLEDLRVSSENSQRALQEELSALQADLASGAQCIKDLETQLSLSTDNTLAQTKISEEYKLRIGQLESEIENCGRTFQEELATLQVKLVSGEVSRKDLESQLFLTKEEAVDQKKLNEEYQLKLEQFQSSHEDYQRTVEEELSGLRADLASGEVSRQDLECQLSVSKEETIARDKIIEEYKVKLDQLLADNESNQRRFEDELSSLREDLTAEQMSSQDLQSQLLGSKEEALAQNKISEDYKLRLKQLQIEHEKCQNTFQEELSALQAELASSNVARDDLQSQLSIAKEEAIHMKNVSEQYLQKVEDLQLSNENCQRALTEELSALQADLVSAKKSMKDLESQLCVSNEETIDQKKLNQEYKLKLEQFHLSHENYQRNVEEELSGLKEELASGELSRKDLESQLSVNKEETIARDKIIEEYKVKVEQLLADNESNQRRFEDELSSLRADLVEEQTSSKLLHSQLSVSKEETLAQNKISEDYKLRLEQLQIENENCQHEFQEKLEALQAELASQKTSTTDLQAQLSITKEEAINLKNINEEYLRKVEELQISNENSQRALKEELSALQADLVSAETSMKDLDSQMSISKEETAIQKKLNEEYQLKLEELQRSNENYRQATLNHHEELSKLLAELEIERTAVLEMKETLSNYEKKFSEKERIHSDIQSELREIKAKAGGLESERKALEWQLATLKEDFMKSEKVIFALRSANLASDVETAEKVKNAREEALIESKKKYMERVAQYKAEVEGILKEQTTKYEDLKKNNEEVLATKTKLESENEKLQREMGQIRRDYIHSQNVIHVMQTTLDKQQKRLEELEGAAAGKLTRAHSTNLSSALSKASHFSDSYLPPPREACSFSTSHAPTTRRSDETDRRLSSVSISSISSNTSTSSGKFKAVPDGSGHFFHCEDEEEFQFQEKKIADLKHKRQIGSIHLPGLSDGVVDERSEADRFSELYRRNSMVPVHLRSCYPSEFITCDDEEVNENELKQLPGYTRSTSGPVVGRLKEPAGLKAQSQSVSTFHVPAPKKVPSSSRRPLGDSSQRLV